MTDAQLLRAAIDASGVVDPRTGLPSTRGVALRILDLDDGTARDVLAGNKQLGRQSRVLCVLVAMRPDLVDVIEVAVAEAVALR
jgi:hypothetical protein